LLGVIGRCNATNADARAAEKADAGGRPGGANHGSVYREQAEDDVGQFVEAQCC